MSGFCIITMSTISFNPANTNSHNIRLKRSQTHVLPASLSKNQNDVFVKSVSPSFGRFSTLEEKFVPFSKELRNYILGNDNIALNQLEKLIKKYSPTTCIREMKDLPQNSNAHEMTLAYFTNKMNFSSDGKVIPLDKEIFLYLPKDHSQKSRLEFLSSLSHEMTHVLQEESVNRFSKLEFIRQICDGKQFTQLNFNTLSGMTKAMTIAELNVFEPLYQALKKTDELPRPIADSSKSMLNKIYLSQTGTTAEIYIDSVIRKTLDYVEKFIGTTDRKKVVEYISLIAGKEKEAYQNSAKLLKQELKLNCTTDLDLRITLYDLFQTKAAEMSKNHL